MTASSNGTSQHLGDDPRAPTDAPASADSDSDSVAGSARPGAGPLGAGPLTDELRELLTDLEQAGQNLGDLAIVKLARVHLGVRRRIRRITVSLGILLVVSGVLMGGSVLLIVGAAGAASAVFDWPPWAGALFASGIALPVILGGVYLRFRRSDRQLAERAAAALRSHREEREEAA